MSGQRKSDDDAGEKAAEARARLGQIREEAGMPRRGDELARSSGSARGGDDFGEPPLDWRLTPRNIFLQALAVGAFVAAIWFLFALLTDSWSAVFGFLTS